MGIVPVLVVQLAGVVHLREVVLAVHVAVVLGGRLDLYGSPTSYSLLPEVAVVVEVVVAKVVVLYELPFLGHLFW